MKRLLFWGTTLLVLVVINLQVAAKERTLHDGRRVLLQLAPVDPRSLIQGDYMRLRYRIAGELARDELPHQGRLVLSLDDHAVASFVRLDDGSPLAPQEQLLVYRNRGELFGRGGLRLGAESFLFQEGDAKLYQGAVYGELQVDGEGNSVLVGLRDAEYERLGRSLFDDVR